MEYEIQTGKSAMLLLSDGSTPGFTECFTIIACGLTNAAEEAGSGASFNAKSVARMCDQMKPTQVGEMLKKAMDLLKEAFPQEEEPAKKKTVIQALPNRAARRKAG